VDANELINQSAGDVVSNVENSVSMQGTVSTKSCVHGIVASIIHHNDNGPPLQRQRPLLACVDLDEE
jgi:hypothetical protein